MKKFNEMVIDKIVTLTKSKKKNFFCVCIKWLTLTKIQKKITT